MFDMEIVYGSPYSPRRLTMPQHAVEYSSGVQGVQNWIVWRKYGDRTTSKAVDIKDRKSVV